MRIGASCSTLTIVLLCFGTSCAPPDELRLLDHIAPDPLAVMVAGETSLDEVYQGWMEMLGRFGSEETRTMAEAGLAEWEQNVGCSLRDDLLARIGPEYAVVLDLPPVDQLMGAMAGGPQAAGGVLTNLGILSTVNEPETLDVCLRKVLGFAEASIVEEDGLVRADLGPPGEVPLAELADFLSPIYIRQLPDVDGWGNTMLVWSDGEHYRIVSPGKDGELDQDWNGDLGDGAVTSRYTADIVFADGQFVAWPEGPQR